MERTCNGKGDNVISGNKTVDGQLRHFTRLLSSKTRNRVRHFLYPPLVAFYRRFYRSFNVIIFQIFQRCVDAIVSVECFSRCFIFFFVSFDKLVFNEQCFYFYYLEVELFIN